MTTHVELPGDNWAEIVDPMDISNAARRPMKRAYTRFVLAMQGIAQASQAVVSTDGSETPDPTLPAPTPPPVDVDELLDATDAFDREALVFCTSSWGGAALDGKEISLSMIDELPSPIFTALSVACSSVIEVLFPNPKAKTGTSPLTHRLAVVFGPNRHAVEVMDLPDWVDDGVRLLACAERFGWSYADYESTPAVVTDRVLQLVEAREIARAEAKD